MARKRTASASGTLVVLEHDSKILAGNPLGDPHVRKLAVWLPPQYDEGATRGRGRRFPVLYDLVGFTGSGLAHTNWKPFGDNVPERAARLIHEKKMGPAIIVFPDCFTALGGNQYVNSSAIGDYADYLTREIIPFVDREFRTLASREHRGCFGKSSGGYGAIIHGMKYAKYWGAIADHSGDAYFDFVYWHDWPNTLNELAKYREPKRVDGRLRRAAREARRARGSPKACDDGRVKRFLDARLEEGEAVAGRGPRDHERLHGRDLRPRPEGAARLPPAVQPRDRRDARARAGATGASTTRSTWSASTRASLQHAAGIYIDCGWRDQYHIHYGTRHPVAAPGRGRHPPHATRNSTTTTPTSTTGWT